MNRDKVSANWEQMAQKRIDRFVDGQGPESLLEFVAPWIMRFLQKRYEADDDAIGEVLLHLTEKMPQILVGYLRYRANLPFRAWLAKIIRNNFHDVLRRGYRQNYDGRSQALFSMGWEAGQADRQIRAIQEEAGSLSEKLMRPLEPRLRVVVKLLYGLELDWDEWHAIWENRFFPGPKSIEEWVALENLRCRNRVRIRQRLDLLARQEAMLLRRKADIGETERERRLARLRKRRFALSEEVGLADLARFFRRSRSYIFQMRSEAFQLIRERYPDSRPDTEIPELVWVPPSGI